jgi:hypothetical protein
MAHATCFMLICGLAAASAFAQERRYRVACFEAFPQFAVAAHILAISPRHAPLSGRTALVVSIGLIAVAVAAGDWPRQIAVVVGVIVAWWHRLAGCRQSEWQRSGADVQRRRDRPAGSSHLTTPARQGRR